MSTPLAIDMGTITDGAIQTAAQALGGNPAIDIEADALSLLRWALIQHPNLEGSSHG